MTTQDPRLVVFQLDRELTGAELADFTQALNMLSALGSGYDLVEYDRRGRRLGITLSREATPNRREITRSHVQALLNTDQPTGVTMLD